MKTDETLFRLPQLFLVLQEKAPELLPTARWVMSMSELAAIALHERQPTQAELDTLVRFFEESDPRLGLFLRKLLRAAHDPGRSLLSEMLLDVLLRTEKWNHPAEVFLCPPIDALLDSCKARLRRRPRDPEIRRRLQMARRRLTKAKELAERAKERREKKEAQLPEFP